MATVKYKYLYSFIYGHKQLARVHLEVDDNARSEPIQPPIIN